MKTKQFKYRTCTCGCGHKYPIGHSKPTGWQEIKDKEAIMRLSDGEIFEKGDIIQRFTEQGKQYCDMVITDIDIYRSNNKTRLKDSMYIRASVVNTGDNSGGSTNITDEAIGYSSADNPNTLRFIKKI